MDAPTAPAYPVATARSQRADNDLFVAMSTGERRVTIDMHRTDLVAALRAVFKAAGIDFSIKSTVEHDEITCAANDVPVDVALKTILESARQSLTYRIEGGIYLVSPK